MAVNSSPFGPKPQWIDGNGEPCVGYQLFSYVGGSVNTKQNTYTDYTGVTANPNPIVLNASGYVPDGLFFTAGAVYKLVLAPPNDTDPPTSPVWTEDGLRGINDTTVTIDQWIVGPTPTFISGTSFTLAGDQTSNFQVNRRLKIVDSSGTKYATISGSSYDGVSLTTVTVTNDGAALVTPLSAVSYGLLSATNPSIPQIITGAGITTVTYVAGAPVITTAAPLTSMLNGTLVATVGSSALTVAVKTLAGADPSASDPVLFVFRNATAATGDYSVISVTAALSLTVSSGSTLGTVSATAARLYIGAINDAGTVRLGIYNPYSSGSIVGLADDGLYSSTAEGGAGAADSAQVIYTGTAVTSKALRVIGYIEATQATAGTWLTAPSKIQIMMPGVPRTGTVIQSVVSSYSTPSTGTGTFTSNNSPRTTADGDELTNLARTITPTSAINILRFELQLNYSTSVTNNIFYGLFQDATVNALRTGRDRMDTANILRTIRAMWELNAGTVSSTTFKIRAGGAAAGTTAINGEPTARDSNELYSALIIIEIFV